MNKFYICGKPHCGKLLTARGYCDAHKPEPRSHRRDERKTAAQRGYDHRWRSARFDWLRSHPLCVICEALGRTTEATEVDHIIPHRGDQKLFWDKNNWQSLCKSHHSKKTKLGC